jgi:DNA-binding FrmR family transcriptional regulator
LQPLVSHTRIGGYTIQVATQMTPETRRQALRRMKILAGQVQALEKQLEEDRYCMDILDLSLSIQKALRSLDGLVIEGHLRTHVIEMMTGGEEDKAVSELLRLYRVQGPGDNTNP